MKVFALPAGEDWVVDRFVHEWNELNSAVATKSPADADILWCVAGWCWNHLPPHVLASKPVVLTVHHIDPTKFGEPQYDEFLTRDKFVDVYHVPCGRSAQVLRRLTKKPIFVQPFWVNTRIWSPQDKDTCREQCDLPADKFLIGSFQRDTEGFDLKTPKLAKGPDVFCDVVEQFGRSKRHDVFVVLAGWRRQYVMTRLAAAGIPYKYFDRPSFDVVNRLYNALDLYIVGSRYEGGPQALFECAATFTPVISTPVGAAEDILGGKECGQLFDIIPEDDEEVTYRRVPDMMKKVNTDGNYDRILEYCIPQGFKPFNRMFERVLKQ